MKLFLSIALLALIGCGSKSTCNITPTNSPAHVRGVDRFGKKHIPPTSVLLPNSIAGVGDEKTYTRFEYDEARHVTPAQWEAAQGLYHRPSEQRSYEGQFPMAVPGEDGQIHPYRITAARGKGGVGGIVITACCHPPYHPEFPPLPKCPTLEQYIDSSLRAICEKDAK